VGTPRCEEGGRCRRLPRGQDHKDGRRLAEEPGQRQSPHQGPGVESGGRNHPERREEGVGEERQGEIQVVTTEPGRQFSVHVNVVNEETPHSDI